MFAREKMRQLVTFLVETTLDYQLTVLSPLISIAAIRAEDLPTASTSAFAFAFALASASGGVHRLLGFPAAGFFSCQASGERNLG